MTIDEALYLFKLHLEHSDQLDHHDFDDAVKLGIEALDYIRRERKGRPGVAYTVLKGETEE